MKVLDVLGSGVAAAAAAVGRVARRPAGVSAEAREELRRRAEINAAGDARRAAREASLSGSTRWLAHRPGWLERRRG